MAGDRQRHAAIIRSCRGSGWTRRPSPGPAAMMQASGGPWKPPARSIPSGAMAVRALCAFHERHGDLAASRAAGTTRQLTRRWTLPARSCWRKRYGGLGEREEASNGSAAWPRSRRAISRAWDCLNAWSREMNCRKVAMEAARSLTQQRGGEARSWLVAARAYDRPEELDARLAALDKAIELNPQCIDAFDLRARSLAAAGRWEEAAAACRPAVFGEHPPVELRARGAWIAAERGDRPRAIAEMRAVVAESPAMFEAWSSLHQWCHEAKDGRAAWKRPRPWSASRRITRSATAAWARPARCATTARAR